MDLTGSTVIPGLVGMHEHLFYPSGGGIPMYTEQAFSFPRLYLASGVTTARTAGSLEPYTDLNIKRLIDAGRMPGPQLFITGPYLEGSGHSIAGPQMHELSGPDDAVAHRRLLGVRGRDLVQGLHEHYARGTQGGGAMRRTARHQSHRAPVLRSASARRPPSASTTWSMACWSIPSSIPVSSPTSARRKASRAGEIGQARHRRTARQGHDRRPGDGITWRSPRTLAVFEAFDGAEPPLEQRFLDALSPEAAVSYLGARARSEPAKLTSSPRLKKELEFERAFVKAGGLLMFGADPTGNGGALAGFADQRNLELLVEGGFTPVEAIQIATYNGAEFLGQLDHIGTVPKASGRPGGDRRQSGGANCGHPEDPHRLQGRCGLPPR